MKNLKQELDKILKEYVKSFEKKHDTYLDGIVSDDIMGVYCFEDFFFNISDIVYDIDNDLPKRMIFQWQDHCMEYDTNYNLESYHKGYRANEIPLHKQTTDLIHYPYPTFTTILKYLPNVTQLHREGNKFFLNETIEWDIEKDLKDQQKETLIYILKNIKI